MQHRSLALFAAVCLFAVPAHADFLLNAQGNQLDLYDLDTTAPVVSPRVAVIPKAADGGRDINAQICRVVQSDGSVRYVAGEDSGQSEGVPQGWGLFDPTGESTPIEPPQFGWPQTGKITPTYNTAPDGHQPEMTGCAVSADGSKLFLVELGAQAFDVEGTGSLFVVYRDTDGDFSGIEKPASERSPICTLANDLTTAGYAALDDDGSVLVPEAGRTSGGVVTRFAPPFPDPSTCAYQGERSTFIHDPVPLRLLTPISIVRRDDPDGNERWLVSQVAPLGVVNEYDGNGEYVRTVVPPGDYNPTGMAVDSDGTLYFADLGLRPDPGMLFTTQNGLGALYRVEFEPTTDLPLPPVPVQVNLDFPEGMGIVTDVF